MRDHVEKLETKNHTAVDRDSVAVYLAISGKKSGTARRRRQLQIVNEEQVDRGRITANRHAGGLKDPVRNLAGFSWARGRWIGECPAGRSLRNGGLLHERLEIGTGKSTAIVESRKVQSLKRMSFTCYERRVELRERQESYARPVPLIVYQFLADDLVTGVVVWAY